jgi:hypothetical protein
MTTTNKIWSMMQILPQEPEDSLEYWNNVVRIFSTCALTRPKDKLVAISGVAKAFQSV